MTTLQAGCARSLRALATGALFGSIAVSTADAHAARANRTGRRRMLLQTVPVGLRFEQTYAVRPLGCWHCVPAVNVCLS